MLSLNWDLQASANVLRNLHLSTIMFARLVSDLPVGVCVYVCVALSVQG